MQRAMAQYVPREMAVLGLVEVALSFLVIYTILTINGTPEWISGSLQSLTAPTAAAAAVLALGISLIALAIGLYQPEVCLDRRRLLPAICLAAGLIFTALLLFGPPQGRLTLGHAVETARLGAAGSGNNDLRPPRLAPRPRPQPPGQARPGARRSGRCRRLHRPPADPPRPQLRARRHARRRRNLAGVAPARHLGRGSRLRRRTPRGRSDRSTASCAACRCSAPQRFTTATSPASTSTRSPPTD